jgi:ferritin-like metal-binding protein YciE
MKTKIKSLNDALAYQLEGLYYAESKLAKQFPALQGRIISKRLQDVISTYTDSAPNKMLKLERVFNYLMKEPGRRTNKVLDELMVEPILMLESGTSDHLTDILTLGCIQNINAYKIASYRSAYLVAVELELDTAADLLQQVLEWEFEISRNLAQLFIEEFNQNPIVNC